MNQTTSPVLGISACLAGEAVRYDAGNKRQPVLMALLTPHLQLQPFCPEVEARLGVPRPPVELIQSSAGHVQVRGIEDPRLDVTQALSATAEKYCRQQLSALSGFIFKSRSPSCGLGSAPLKDTRGSLLDYHDGLFASRLRRVAPWLPCVEESWLKSPEHCYRFLTACWAAAHYHHQYTGHGWLMESLERELAADSDECVLHAIIEYLLTPAPTAGNTKAAQWGRLLEYWQSL
ncbi:MAG: DUF523 domain-containing protein [Cellvibrionaceae bacterium]